MLALALLGLPQSRGLGVRFAQPVAECPPKSVAFTPPRMSASNLLQALGAQPEIIDLESGNPEREF